MLTITLLFSILAGSGSGDSPIKPLWKVDLKTFLESAASVADIDQDGDDEILVAGREEIIAVDGNGKILWRVPGKVRFMTYPTILNLQNRALIYAADCGGWMHCWDGKGTLVWEKELAGPAEWSAAVVLTGQPNEPSRIIQTDTTGMVWAFDAVTGEVVWKTNIEGAGVSPCVADVNNDSLPEIIVASANGMLFCLNSSGNVLWSHVIGAPSPTWATGAPIVFSTATQGAILAAPAAEGGVTCFSGTGDILWKRQLRGPLASGLSAGDIDEDGVADLFAITQLGVVYRFTETGNPVWEIDMQGRTLAAGAILDVNADGKQDFILCTQQGLLLAIDQDAHIFYQWQAPSRTINVTPTFGQLTSETDTLEMVITGGEAGILYCFSTAATPPYKTKWTAYRGNAAKTGAWLELQTHPQSTMQPVNLQWDRVYLDEPIRFHIVITEKHEQPFDATASVVHPDGLRQGVSGKVVGETGELHLPLIPTAPGVYSVSWRLESDSGKVLCENNRTLTLGPFANEIALLQEAIQRAEEVKRLVVEQMPLSAKALERETTILKAKQGMVELVRASWHDENYDRENAVQQVTDIVRTARHVRRAADTILQAFLAHNDTGIILSEGELWENRDLASSVPADGKSVSTLEKWVVPGEHEPVALNLFNITDRELVVRIQVTSDDRNPVVSVLRPMPVPTSSGAIVWDALPTLDSSRTVTIPSLETRQVWLDVDFSGAAPRKSVLRAVFQVLNGPGVLEPPHNPRNVPAPAATVELVFDVLPFEMASYESMRMCTWAKPDPDTLTDLLQHGNNVFVVSMPPYQPKRDGAGEAALQTEKIDAILERLANHGVFVLMSGIPDLFVPFGSEEYQKIMADYLGLLVPYLESKGFDVTRFALYPWDEPGGHGWDAVERVAVFGEMVKKVRPDVQVYVNGGGEVPMFERMAPVTDIWCPSIYMLPEDSGEMAIMRKSGKALWSYNCAYGFARPVGANIKDINIIAEFRTAALFAFRYGASGIGYWCYNIGDDMWQRVRDEYPLVYPADNGSVVSRRWEAVREGIEDYRILVALQNRVETSQTSVSPEVRNGIDELQRDLEDWMDKGFQEMRLGLPRYAFDLTYNERSVNQFRERLLDLVAACIKP